MCDYDVRKGLNEFVLYPSTVDEAGEEEAQPTEDPTAAPEGNPTMGGAPDPNMGGAPAPGGDPTMGGAPAPGGDPNMGGDPTMGGAPADASAPATPEGFAPQDAAVEGGDITPESFDTQQPGDEVLDVTELTDKQDDIEKEIHEVGGKFDEVLKAIGSFEELIRANDEKIEDLKAEIERRNPTQIEKLGNRKTLSYPFNVSPDEYWKDKEVNSNYSTEEDDNGKEQGQYVITANDVNGDTNWQAIAKSLDDKDFFYNQTLDKLMKL